MSHHVAPAPLAPAEGSLHPSGSLDPESRASWLLARIGSERFALPLESVAELIEDPALEPVPTLTGDALGMIVARGGRMPIWNPARLLGQTPSLPPRSVLVVEYGDDTAAIAVDETADVVELHDAAVVPVPALDDPYRLVLGVVRDEFGLITVLDFARFVRVVGSADAEQV